MRALQTPVPDDHLAAEVDDADADAEPEADADDEGDGFAAAAASALCSTHAVPLMLAVVPSPESSTA
jgi:hypothetical protein